MKKSFLALAFSSVFSIAFMACGDSGSDAGDSDSNWKKKSSSDPSTFIDARDGEEYRTVRIGNQLWMAENLRFNDTLWMPFLIGCSKADEFGRRYTYIAAMGKQDYIDSGYNEGICPIGWHLPSMTEFDVMKNFVKEFCPSVDSCLRTAEGWEYAGNDRFGFNARYSSEMRGAHYWTSNPANGVRINSEYGYSYRSNSTDAVMYGLQDSYSYNTFSADFDSKGNMNYVRCVKGSEEDSATAIKNYLKTRDDTIEYLSSSAAYQAYLSSSSAAEWARIQQGAKVYFNEALDYGYFTDERDSNVYGYLKIGTYTWMTENLRYYFNTDSNCDSYLSCYTFNKKKQDTLYYYKVGLTYSSAQKKKACPAGWHLPSSDEWKDLLATAATTGALLANDGVWNSIMMNPTNATGFTMVATNKDYDGYQKPGSGNDAQFWASDERSFESITIDTIYVENATEVPEDSLPADTIVVDSTAAPDSVEIKDPEMKFFLDTTYTMNHREYVVKQSFLSGFEVFPVDSGDYHNSSNIRCVMDY